MAKTSAVQSFSSILNRAPSEIEKPKPLPQGSYTTILVGQPRIDKSAKKQTEFREFTHKILAAGEDVDADELETYLGDSKKLTEVLVKNTYYITEGSIWRLKEFCEHCGLDLTDYETLAQAIEATPGCQVGVYINHEPSQDGTSVFARINKTFVVE
jgi:hypothetical protein